MVLSNGLVRWKVSAVVKTSCLLNVKLFPFDSQRCSIDFGSSMIRMLYDVAPVNMIYDQHLQSVVGNTQELEVSQLGIVA